jgi:hypothetical protein
MHNGSSGAKEEKYYWYHCWLVGVERQWQSFNTVAYRAQIDV